MYIKYRVTPAGGGGGGGNAVARVLMTYKRWRGCTGANPKMLGNSAVQKDIRKRVSFEINY